jgi:hypothetical protein
MRAEGKIRLLKAELKALGKENSVKNAAALEKRIEALWQTIYIWKCFGDGIAFTYMDKYALIPSLTDADPLPIGAIQST